MRFVLLSFCAAAGLTCLLTVLQLVFNVVLPEWLLDVRIISLLIAFVLGVKLTIIFLFWSLLSAIVNIQVYWFFRRRDNE